MAVKARNKKRLKMQEMVKDSIRIKCSHCLFSDSCKNKLKEVKLKSEEMGINTYCSFAKKKASFKKNKRYSNYK